MIKQNQTDLSGKLAFDTKGMDELRASAKQNSPDSIKASAKQFEALFMNMVMKSMRAATPQDGMLDNQQSQMFTSMLDQQMSQNMAKRGVGLADVLIRQLSGAAGVQPPGAVTGKLTEAANLRPEPGNAVSSLRSARADAVKSIDAGKLPPMPDALKAGRSTALDAPRHHSARPAHVREFQDRLAGEAEEASRVTGIPAKFMLAQAALESGWGKKEIVAADGSASHNLFGIKAGNGWKGRVVEAATIEYVNGVPQRKLEKFRAYDTYADAFRDYGKLLQNNPRYQNVMANASDVTGFAQGLQRAGYATDPNYASKLTSIIKKSLSA